MEANTVVDDAPSSRRFSRDLRKNLLGSPKPSAILLSRYPVDDDLPRFRLKLTTQDIRVVKANLAKAGWKVDDAEYPDLWKLLKAVAREADVAGN